MSDNKKTVRRNEKLPAKGKIKAAGTKSANKKGAENPTIVRDNAIPSPKTMAEHVIATRLVRDQALANKSAFKDRVIVSLIAALGLSVVGVVALGTRETSFKYFAVDTGGRMLELSSLDEPMHSAPYITKWTSEAVMSAFSFSFADYQRSLNSSRKYFTDFGFESFINALNEASILESVKANSYVVTAIPRGALTITGQGYIDGVYAWKIEVPVMVSYQALNTTNTSDLLLEVYVVRRHQLEQPSGLGISKIIAK